MEKWIVTRRVNLTVEPGSVVLVSGGQLKTARGYLDEYDESDIERQNHNSMHISSFSEATYRVMFSKLTVLELLQAASEMGMAMQEDAKKSDITEALIQKVAQ